MNQRDAVTVSRPAWLGALAGIVVGCAYGLLGAILAGVGSPKMGSTLFIFLPLVVGATIALVTPKPFTGAALLAGTISLVLCLMGLIAAKVEGFLCAFMAFPIVFGFLAIGILFGLLFKHVYKSLTSGTSLLVLALGPMLLSGSAHWENKALSATRTQNVTTTVFLPATPDVVWRNIESQERVIGHKGILMRIGLPIPQRCVLSGTSSGSKRTCYFDQGFIEESILEWDPPRRMRLAIDRTHMPGRHWLEFDGAEYALQPVPGGTVLSRTTIIRSHLQPAWYWGRLERWGVSAEHEYLFSDLQGRFAASHQP